MKSYGLLLLFSLILSTVCLSQFSLNEEQKKLINETAFDYPNNSQLSIAIVKGNEILFHGIIKEEDNIREIENKDSIFEIGSITKVFTSLLLSKAVLEDKLTLDDKAHKYLPFKLNKKIRIKQLANHTSGLPRVPRNFAETVTDLNDPYSNYTKENIKAYFDSDSELDNKAGTHYAYSNLGPAVLASVLEQIEQKEYAKLLEEFIFRPMGLSSSFINSNSIQIVPGHNEKGKVIPYWTWHSCMSAAGGIKSNVVDLAKFIQAHFDTENKLLRLAQNPTFKVNDEMSIGLGWHLLKIDEQAPVLWHNGRTAGFTSSMVIRPESEYGIIILSNAAYNNLDRLTFELLKTL